MKILDSVKVALKTKTTNTQIEEQLNVLIQSCIADLKSAKIKVESVGDEYPPQIDLAICTYVKAYFLSADNDKFEQSYASQKSQLALLKEFMEE